MRVENFERNEENCAKRVICLRIGDFEGRKSCGCIRGC